MDDDEGRMTPGTTCAIAFLVIFLIVLLILSGGLDAILHFLAIK